MGNLCSTPSPSNKFKQSTFLAQEYKGVTFEAVSGDIIEAEADAIVNGTNPQLSHNNGLGNNLLSKGGQVIQEESDKIRAGYESDLPIGTAVITQAGHLKARYIIHVVTPIWTGGSNNEEQKLGECVLNALTKAEENRLKSIAVPSLAGGLLEFPKEKASKIIVQHCVQYLDKVGTTSLQSIKFINTNAAFVNAFKDAVQNTLRAAETGENINLAREETEVQTETTQFVEREREEITIVKTTEDAGRKEKRAYLPPQEDEPVVQHQQEIREEKPQDVIVEEKHVDIIHQEKPVEELRHESPVVEHKQEEVPVVEQKKEEVPVIEEKVVVEEKPVEQPVVEEKQEEAPVVEQKKEEVPVIEEKVVEEEKPVEQPVVEEKVIEEEKPVEQPVEEKQEVPVVEEKQEEVPVVEHKQEEVAVVEEKVVEEEKPVEQPVEEKVVEEEKPVEQPVEEKVEEQTQETEAIKTEQEESKTQEVKQSEETEENKENDDATTQADTEGGNQAEGAEEEGNKEEEGASKKTSKKNKKNKKKN